MRRLTTQGYRGRDAAQVRAPACAENANEVRETLHTASCAACVRVSPHTPFTPPPFPKNLAGAVVVVEGHVRSTTSVAQWDSWRKLLHMPL
jgi:hypothetical protein